MALPGRTTLDHAIVRLLPTVPRPIVRHLSSRYIAGPSIDDAIRVVRGLNEEHKLATVDVLGEEATNADEVRVTAGLYHDVLARIGTESLDAGISIKLTGHLLSIARFVTRATTTSVPSFRPTCGARSTTLPVSRT